MSKEYDLKKIGDEIETAIYHCMDDHLQSSIFEVFENHGIWDTDREKFRWKVVVEEIKPLYEANVRSLVIAMGKDEEGFFSLCKLILERDGYSKERIDEYFDSDCFNGTLGMMEGYMDSTVSNLRDDLLVEIKGYVR